MSTITAADAQHRYDALFEQHLELIRKGAYIKVPDLKEFEDKVTKLTLDCVRTIETMEKTVTKYKENIVPVGWTRIYLSKDSRHEWMQAPGTTVAVDNGDLAVHDGDKITICVLKGQWTSWYTRHSTDNPTDDADDE